MDDNIQTGIKENNRISPTAKLVAYWRAMSGIHYADEIAETANTKETAEGFFDKETFDMISGFVMPYIEARFRTINYHLDNEGTNNILELAMGLSPRGLEYASKGSVYVGTDLPDILKESSNIILMIAERDEVPSENLNLTPANVLRKEELEEAAEYFGNGEIGICNEGLLLYLNEEEKAIMAENVRDVLLKHGGVWITPDIDTLDKMEERSRKYPDPVFRKIREKAFEILYEKTGCNVLENFFRTDEEALRFYREIGFSVEMRPFYNINELTSFRNVPEMMRNYVAEWINDKKTWVMRPKE